MNFICVFIEPISSTSKMKGIEYLSSITITKSIRQLRLSLIKLMDSKNLIHVTFNF